MFNTCASINTILTHCNSVPTSSTILISHLWIHIFTCYQDCREYRDSRKYQDFWCDQSILQSSDIGVIRILIEVTKMHFLSKNAFSWLRWNKYSDEHSEYWCTHSRLSRILIRFIYIHVAILTHFDTILMHSCTILTHSNTICIHVRRSRIFMQFRCIHVRISCILIQSWTFIYGSHAQFRRIQT